MERLKKGRESLFQSFRKGSKREAEKKSNLAKEGHDLASQSIAGTESPGSNGGQNSEPGSGTNIEHTKANVPLSAEDTNREAATITAQLAPSKTEQTVAKVERIAGGKNINEGLIYF
jgi:hypothetical protein